jgi:uncharacterized Ntn-hydrolase superfamily protein
VTYSVIARDEDSGQFGAAVQSHWLAVGAIVPWAAAGVGVLVTQANSDLSAGRRGLELLRAGRSAIATLDSLLGNNPRAAVSQIAVLDASGEIAAHTGARCVAEAGHQAGSGWSVQANMMLRPTVPAAMAAAWEGGAGLPLADRMLSVLHAAQEQGGDVRGMQSAALQIVSGQEGGDPLETIINVRTDDSADPIGELERLCRLAVAYREHEMGLSLLPASPGRALEHWARAAVLAPGSQELQFWHAVALAATGNTGAARGMLQSLSEVHAGWRTMFARLAPAGLLPADADWLPELPG